WHYVGQSIPLLLEASPAAAILKISTLPARLAPLLRELHALADQASFPHAILARACGVLYFALLPPADTTTSLYRLAEVASAVFSLCSAENALASLPWCPTQLKRHVNIWSSDFVAPVSSRHFPPSGSAVTRSDIV